MTYSIAARDRATGELGVAVQSAYFTLGPVVPRVEAGVGAVATQSLVNVAFGPAGLSLLRSGFGAPEAVKALVAGDSEPGSARATSWRPGERRSRSLPT